ncbi:MAG: hypothetical protein AAGA48_35045 [Myxococcota bacterium]
MIPWLTTALALASPPIPGELLPTPERLPFPDIAADNLLGEDRAYPGWYERRTSLVLLVWTREQQRVANTWLTHVDALTQAEPSLSIVEHPVVAPFYRLIKGRVDGWMRGGIPSDAARARTVTLFTGAQGFADQLGIDDRSTISALLVDANGRVAKQWRGPANDTVMADVVASVQTLAAEMTP